MSLNVLARAAEARVTSDPFPYLVIDQALPWDVYDRLAATYPDPERLSGEQKAHNNRRYNLIDKGGDAEFPYDDAHEAWRDFTEENTSSALVARVFDLFPEFTTGNGAGRRIDVERFGKGCAERLGIAPTLGMDEVLTRVTIGVNSPVRTVSSVRGAHMDHITKTYVGLLYFRAPDDASTGGDLELFRWKDGVSPEPWSTKVPREKVEVVDTVHYAPNRLVMFLNTSNALHGVSPRSVTDRWRRLVVVHGSFTEREPKKKGILSRGVSGIGTRLKAMLPS